MTRLRLTLIISFFLFISCNKYVSSESVVTTQSDREEIQEILKEQFESAKKIIMDFIPENNINLYEFYEKSEFELKKNKFFYYKISFEDSSLDIYGDNIDEELFKNNPKAFRNILFLQLIKNFLNTKILVGMISESFNEEEYSQDLTKKIYFSLSHVVTKYYLLNFLSRKNSIYLSDYLFDKNYSNYLLGRAEHNLLNLIGLDSNKILGFNQLLSFEKRVSFTNVLGFVQQNFIETFLPINKFENTYQDLSESSPIFYDNQDFSREIQGYSTLPPYHNYEKVLISFMNFWKLKTKGKKYIEILKSRIINHSSKLGVEESLIKENQRKLFLENFKTEIKENKSNMKLKVSSHSIRYPSVRNINYFKDSLVICSENYKESKGSISLNNSAIIFLQYLYCKEKNYPVKPIQVIKRSFILNEETLSIMNIVSTDPELLDTEIPIESPLGLALLATPNGKSAMWLSHDYFEEMEHRVPSRVKVDGDDMYIYFEKYKPE